VFPALPVCLPRVITKLASRLLVSLRATGSFVASMDVGAAARTVRANFGGYVLLWLVTVGGALIVLGMPMGLVALVTIPPS
jgi:hypothetical protein